jgi:hypothetical protein
VFFSGGGGLLLLMQPANSEAAKTSVDNNFIPFSVRGFRALMFSVG